MVALKEDNCKIMGGNSKLSIHPLLIDHVSFKLLFKAVIYIFKYPVK